ncbi:MAG: type II secretion system protein M [Marinobacter sp.]|uniref:type II secretion system protein GspM n=1 Tax=Marinobacter sp. TaxID=50741 RepID=UPI0034A02D17
MAKLTEHPSVQKLIAQYDQLPRRDQKALVALTVAVILFIVYFAIWRPVSTFHDDATDARENAAELVSWMEANRSTIQLIAASGTESSAPSSITDGRALMSTVTRSAGEAGLALQRFEPSGENGIRVWLENAPFSQVALWLETLNSEYGIAIDQAALDRGNSPGHVSVRLTLEI